MFILYIIIIIIIIINNNTVLHYSLSEQSPLMMFKYSHSFYIP